MKQIVLLLSMFAQLLIGSGIPAFACISKDGSFNLVTASSFCNVCLSHSDDDDHSCNETEAEHKDGVSFNAQGNCGHETILIAETCGCKHVPGMLVSDASTRRTRILFSIDLEQMNFIMLPWSAIPAYPFLPLQTSSIKNLAAAAHDIAIYVLSTIVIRC